MIELNAQELIGILYWGESFKGVRRSMTAWWDMEGQYLYEREYDFLTGEVIY